MNAFHIGYVAPFLTQQSCCSVYFLSFYTEKWLAHFLNNFEGFVNFLFLDSFFFFLLSDFFIRICERKICKNIKSLLQFVVYFPFLTLERHKLYSQSVTLHVWVWIRPLAGEMQARLGFFIPVGKQANVPFPWSLALKGL